MCEQLYQVIDLNKMNFENLEILKFLSMNVAKKMPEK